MIIRAVLCYVTDLFIRSQTYMSRPFPWVSAHFLHSLLLCLHLSLMLGLSSSICLADPSPSTPLWMLRRSKHNGVCVPVAALRRRIDIAAHSCFLRLKEIMRRGMNFPSPHGGKEKGGGGSSIELKRDLRVAWRQNTCSCIYAHMNATMCM